MRFIHTSDWHLGRSFYNTSLIEDQAYALDQLVNLAKEHKPDLVLIAGDVYDRAVPSPEAVRLLDDVLTRLILENQISVLLIAGNHDSPLRLHFGARLMRSLRLYVFGVLAEPESFIQMPDEHGLVCFYAMPYAEPAVVRARTQNDAITNPESALGSWLDAVRSVHPPQARSVIVAHAFVQGGIVSESERQLSIGGTETVSNALFSGFNYVALGHLHRPQSIGPETVHYSGSLLKYSFSECDHRKSVNVVEMDAAGNCRVEPIPIRPKREVRVVEGYLDDLLRDPPQEISREDFVRFRLLDKGALYEPMSRLRQAFPNALGLDRPGLIDPESTAILPTNPRSNDARALFRDFFSQVMNEPLSAEQDALFVEIIDDMQQAEREAEP
jgi:exonuclease SbcD